MTQRKAVRDLTWFALLVISLSGLTGCANVRDRPMIELTLDHPEGNAAKVILSDGRALIDVTDSRGINGLTARLEQGEWPETITVRLRLRGLEHLEISYDNITLTSGRSSNDSPDPPLILAVTDENGEVAQASPSASIYYPEIEQSDDGFDITLPPHFFSEERPSFAMQWIDFYRN